MNVRITLVLLLLAVLAYVAIRLLGDPPAPAPPRLPLVPGDEVGELQEIELKLFSDEILKLVRNPGGRYVMRFGRDREGQRYLYEDDVKQEMVSQLLRAVNESWREPFFGEATRDNLVRFQLADPKYVLTVRGADGECTIHFGADDPGGFGVLAREAGKDVIFRSGRQVPNLLDQNLVDWRERRLFQVDSRTIDQIELAELKTGRFLQVVRHGADTWRVEVPRSLRADGSRVRALAHRLSSLEVQSFLAQGLENPEVRKQTGFPDELEGVITVTSGQFGITLEIGKEVGEGHAARVPQRGETIFTVAKEELDAVWRITEDDLRPRTLTPAIESKMVALAAKAAGEVKWRAEREALSPRGKWRLVQPFEAALNEGAAPHSWPQVVVDVDRVEFQGFLGPADESFAAERELIVSWKSGELTREVTAELMRDGDRILLRSSEDEGELMLAPERLWEIAGLDPRKMQARVVFPPRSEFQGEITRWELIPDQGEPIVLSRGSGGTPVVERGSETLGPRLTSAVTYLFGYEAVDLLLPEEAAGAFDRTRFTLKLEAGGVDHELLCGQETGRGFLCRLDSRFPGLVLVVERTRLEELLRLCE